MAIKTIAEIKAFFETGDTPTQAQFGDLIDTLKGEYFVIVQNYSDIAVLFTGIYPITFYVLTDSENMAGKKGAYRYVPGFTDTPAQLAINFND